MKTVVVIFGIITVRKSWALKPPTCRDTKTSFCGKLLGLKGYCDKMIGCSCRNLFILYLNTN